MKPSELMYAVAAVIEESLVTPGMMFEDRPVPYWGACEILERLGGMYRNMLNKKTAKARFRELYEEDAESVFWFGKPHIGDYPFKTPHVGNQNHRLIAVLMTAVILKSEGQ